MSFFDESGLTLERVLLEANLLLPRARLRLEAWPDRWVQFDARQASKKGWVWQFAAEGRLVGGHGPVKLVTTIEASIAAAGAPIALGAIWDPILAKGPRLIA